MTATDKLVWHYGPETRTKRCGCIKHATWGKHTWEIHRTYERSLISGRNVVTAQLYLDGQRIGSNYGSLAHAIAKADEQRAALQGTGA